MKASSPSHSFIDRLEISVSSGKGGAGCVSFRREAKVPRGGPDGGDGGKGGSVYIVGDPRKHSLVDYRYKRKYTAKNGQPGSGQKKAGKTGEDALLPVPLGTQIISKQDSKVLLDITEEGKFLLLEGGKGGLGNWHFRNSRHQAPEFSQTGIEGESLDLVLELKLIADVGLLGYPNAGKSTLISVLSHARPKVGSYPFTTLSPQLGVLQHKQKELVIADLPGIIEKASEGVGLGHQFLRHAERTKFLLHLVSLDPNEVASPTERYLQLREELKLYSEKFNSDLHDKKEVVLLSKSDLISPQQMQMVLEEFRPLCSEVFVISSATHHNIVDLKDFLIEGVH